MSTSEWTTPPGPDIEIWCPEEFDLSGGAVTVPVFSTKGLPQAWGNSPLLIGSVVGIVKQIMVVYTEATAGTDATYDDIILVGTDTNAVAFHSYTIPASQAIDVTGIILQADFSGDGRLFDFPTNAVSSLKIATTGGASGAGKVRVGVLFTQDGSQWSSFVE